MALQHQAQVIWDDATGTAEILNQEQIGTEGRDRLCIMQDHRTPRRLVSLDLLIDLSGVQGPIDRTAGDPWQFDPFRQIALMRDTHQP
jgi:hypothetical protein